MKLYTKKSVGISMSKKKVIFLTGTRADFGKLKPLISKAIEDEAFDCYIFVTGMHTLTRYGNTIDEVYNSFQDTRLEGGFRNIFVYINQIHNEPMEHVLANTIQGLSRYVSELNPDMIVIHGDRVEAMAGAIVGSIRNILVAHVEGGEISGTIDELIRHSTSKMSHIHFVSNEKAARRLIQLGELSKSIFVIGSPDVDLMVSDRLPTLEEVKDYYDINFNFYGIVIFHPVTTDLVNTKKDAIEIVNAIKILDHQNFVVIYPNNDEGTNLIMHQYNKLSNNKNVTVLPSMRIESFLTLLKNSEFILGNSSAGIIEAPVYGTKTINISHRQKNRHSSPSIFNCRGKVSEIVELIEKVKKMPRFQPDYTFGKGNSADQFIHCLKESKVWEISTQKQFVDL